MNDEVKGMLLGLLAVVAFGLTLPATRYVVTYLDPVFIGLGRSVVAAVVAAALLVLTRASLPNSAQVLRLAFVALGVVVGFPVLSAVAMQTLPAAHGGVVLGILPLMTVIAGVGVSGERPSAGFWAVAVLGSALVVAYSLRGQGSAFERADLLLFLAIMFAALGYALGAKLAKQLGAWQVICWALVIALPFIALPAWRAAPGSGTELPLSVILCFTYLALISQLFGFFAWYKGLALGGVARVSQMQLLQPFVTIVASAWFLNEIIDSATLVFAALVVGSVAIGKRMPVKTTAEAQNIGVNQ